MRLCPSHQERELNEKLLWRVWNSRNCCFCLMVRNFELEFDDLRGFLRNGHSIEMGPLPWSLWLCFFWCLVHHCFSQKSECSLLTLILFRWSTLTLIAPDFFALEHLFPSDNNYHIAHEQVNWLVSERKIPELNCSHFQSSYYLCSLLREFN